MQVIERNDFGSLLGASLGSGIGQLAQQKIKQMQTNKGLGGLGDLLGINNNQIKSLSFLPPYMQFSILSRLMGSRKSSFRKGNTKKSSAKVLDPETAKQILDEVGGDKHIARKMAQELGYKF